MKDGFDPIGAAVKLVIWDLDETFWKGTLSEGGIEPVQANIEIVRTLVDRGIMCSICSKNDFAEAREKLAELGVFDLFVFPHIDWTPKGQAISSMIGAMGLRDENVLFLDDNHMNLKEAAFFNERLMCVAGDQELDWLLSHPNLKGKDDRSHSRLNQYRMLQDKTESQASDGMSNVEFLRQSEIRLTIVADFSDKMDRVYELINRTNQLNYTKKRLETDAEKQEFQDMLKMPGVHAGLIHAADKFGDYGFVGFFMSVIRANRTRLDHFAFSCRTLNMGVEQFVYEFLEEPAIKVSNPVANDIKSFDQVDWISFAKASEMGAATSTASVCLLGGCDLLQTSFYLGAERKEFVNYVRDGSIIRYDDPGFFINPRDRIKSEPILSAITTWTHADMLEFDRALGDSDRIVISLFQAMGGQNYFTFGGKEFGGEYLIHMPPQALRFVLNSDKALFFAKKFHHRDYSLDDKAGLIRASYDVVRDRRNPGSTVFLIGAGTLHGDTERTMRFRTRYNEITRQYCEENEGFVFLDVDELIAREHHVDAMHFSRLGYYALAQHIENQS